MTQALQIAGFQTRFWTLQILHISDTHFGPDRFHSIRGAPVCQRVEFLLQKIEELSFQPDFIVHTGDVVNQADEKAYELAAEVLGRLSVPVYYAMGNHDDRDFLFRHLKMGKHTLLRPGTNRVGYRIERPDGSPWPVDCYVLDGMVPEKEGPHGWLPEEDMDALLAALVPGKPVAIFLHFPLLPIGAKWVDEYLPLQNGKELLQRLQESVCGEIRGIFTGHYHRQLHQVHRGVLHSGVSSPVCEFAVDPDEDSCDFLPDCAAPFHHITLEPDFACVKGYAYPYPEFKDLT